MRPVTALLLLVLAFACGDDAAEEEGSEAACAANADRAAALLEDANTCDSDADCALVTVEAECLVPFVCPVLVNQDTDLDRLRSRARELAKTEQRCQAACPTANCAPPDTFRIACDPAEHRCTVAAPLGDAGER